MSEEIRFSTITRTNIRHAASTNNRYWHLTGDNPEKKTIKDPSRSNKGKGNNTGPQAGKGPAPAIREDEQPDYTDPSKTDSGEEQDVQERINHPFDHGVSPRCTWEIRMVVAKTIHASSPASTGMSRFPADTVRASAPAQASVCRYVDGNHPVIQGRAGDDPQYCADGKDKKADCRKEPDVKRHRLSPSRKSRCLPGPDLSRITVLKWRTGTYQTSRNPGASPGFSLPSMRNP